MGEDPRRAGTAVSDSPDPAAIRADIEQTRQELGETVAAIAHKTDVKTRVRERRDALQERARARVEEVRERIAGPVTGTPPGGSSLAERAQRLAGQGQRYARENPHKVRIVAAFLGGLVLGRLRRRGRTAS